MVAPDGPSHSLDVPAGPPLGLGGLPFESVELELPEGSLLALYTDGLLETRDRDLDDGHRRAARRPRAPRRPGGRSATPCSTAMLPDDPDDDVALLVARTRALDADRVASWDLPPDPAAVAPPGRAAGQLTAWGLDEAAFTTELVGQRTGHQRHPLRPPGPIKLRLIRTTAP